MRLIIEQLFTEQSEEDVKANRVIADICTKNEVVFPELLMVNRYFSGFDSALIIEKINELSTPLISSAIYLTH